MTFGWILLLDPQLGLINTKLRQLVGGEAGPLNIYSFWGIILVLLYSSQSRPLPILMLEYSFVG